MPRKKAEAVVDVVPYEQKALAEFSLTPAEVQAKAKEYLALKVVPDDGQSYKVARSALTVCVHTRTGIEKRRLELNKADRETIKDKIDKRDEVAAWLTNYLSPVETHLSNELDLEDGRRAEIKAEKARIEQARVDKIIARIDWIKSLPTMTVGKSAADIKTMFDGLFDAEIFVEEFQEFEGRAMEVRIQTLDALSAALDARRKWEAEEVARKAEAARLEEQRKAQEAEAARLAAEREALEAQARKVREAQEAQARQLDEESRRIQEAKTRAAFELAARQKAEVEAREKVEREAKEAQARAEAEAKAKAEREAAKEAERVRKEALRPDKEKLLTFCDNLKCLEIPEVKDARAKNIASRARTSLVALSIKIRQAAEAL